MAFSKYKRRNILSKQQSEGIIKVKESRAIFKIDAKILKINKIHS